MNEDNNIANIAIQMREIGARARKAAQSLAVETAERKTAALLSIADEILAQSREIIAANAQDMQAGEEKGLSAAMLDRLKLDEGRIGSIAHSVREVAKQEDPIGRVTESWERPNGLHIERVQTPIGVIGVIYESRPNVTADAGALCLKSGNAVILRGGSESFHSAQAIFKAMQAGLRAVEFPQDAIQMVPDRDRAAVTEMLRMTDYIDVIVPRGGKGLVGLVQREARVPVFAHLDGIVHIYIDKEADPEKTRAVVLNAKTRRTGICGAAECILINDAVASTIGRDVVQTLLNAGVRVHGDEHVQQLAQGVTAATEEDWGREYLDMDIAARIVPDLDAAIAHIAEYGSHHTDCIMTEDAAAAQRFMQRVDSAIVMQNSSTQFADGGEFGMGAEIGISTGKLHARGPVGATQLTSFKYRVKSDGAVRG